MIRYRTIQLKTRRFSDHIVRTGVESNAISQLRSSEGFFMKIRTSIRDINE
jgi:hypothetical protein